MAPAAEPPPEALANPCAAREILARVGDKWSMYVIHLLGTETKRFSEILRAVDGISQRMLTVTLRGLERDGILERTVYPVIPPRVEYKLTPLGHTLIGAVGAVVAWAGRNVATIEAARAAYDAAAGAGPGERDHQEAAAARRP